MLLLMLILILMLAVMYSDAAYVTTCHSDKECGTICGTYGPDTVAPTEGMLGIECTCQNNLPPVYKCTIDGLEVKVCSDNKPPSCTSTYCNKQICIKMNGKQTTATVRSACPKYHPQNAEQCCQHGGSYCTCIKQETLDLNYQPYRDLGGANGYTTDITYGACGSQDTHINIYSQEGAEYLKQFDRYLVGNLRHFK